MIEMQILFKWHQNLSILIENKVSNQVLFQDDEKRVHSRWRKNTQRKFSRKPRDATRNFGIRPVFDEILDEILILGLRMQEN